MANYNSAYTGEQIDQAVGQVLAGGVSITVDSELSSTSENPVQNKVISNALGGKASKVNLGQGQLPCRTLSGTGEANTGIGYSSAVGNDTIVQRTSTGTIKASTPTEDTDVANKAYVDSASNGKVASTTITSIEKVSDLPADPSPNTLYIETIY